MCYNYYDARVPPEWKRFPPSQGVEEMTQYTFTVKLSLENEMRPDMLEFLVANAMRTLNVNVLAGPEQHPTSVDVKGRKG